MIKITVTHTHNGKEYNSIEDATQAALVSGTEKMIQKKLLPFADEIKKENGTVNIRIGDLLKGGHTEVSVSGVSEGLKAKIQAALHE